MQSSSATTSAKGMQQIITDFRPWFHNLHLPDGSQTAPEHVLGDFPAYKWREIGAHLPEDLSGWDALDIGCNAGFYSFELARRGAQVTAIDLNPHYLAQARWAAGQFGLENSIDFRLMQIYDLAGNRERFDLVLFLGVFYHLRYPLLGLDIVSSLARRLLVFQTLTMPGEEVIEPTDQGIFERSAMEEAGWPKMAFIEKRLADDPTNWWAANHAGVEAMLRSSGLRVTARPGREVYLCEPDPENPSCIASWNRAEFDAATGVTRRR
ncbi:MAG: TIGR04290 family methyltransferase [Desulfuromonadales bacterium]